MHDDTPPSDASDADFEAGVAAIGELVPDMDDAAIRQAIRAMADAENVPSGVCAQMVRTELEAGRLPVDQFKAHSDTP